MSMWSKAENFINISGFYWHGNKGALVWEPTCNFAILILRLIEIVT